MPVSSSLEVSITCAAWHYLGIGNIVPVYARKLEGVAGVTNVAGLFDF
jgi:hypothetical protein